MLLIETYCVHASTLPHLVRVPDLVGAKVMEHIFACLANIQSASLAFAIDSKATLLLLVWMGQKRWNKNKSVLIITNLVCGIGYWIENNYQTQSCWKVNKPTFIMLANIGVRALGQVLKGSSEKKTHKVWCQEEILPEKESRCMWGCPSCPQRLLWFEKDSK